MRSFVQSLAANVHHNIRHSTAVGRFNHNRVGVQQDGGMSCRTAGRGLNNAGKDNVVDAGLVPAVGATVSVSGEVCDYAAMLPKNCEDVLVIPGQTDVVG